MRPAHSCGSAGRWGGGCRSGLGSSSPGHEFNQQTATAGAALSRRLSLQTSSLAQFKAVELRFCVDREAGGGQAGEPDKGRQMELGNSVSHQSKSDAKADICRYAPRLMGTWQHVKRPCLSGRPLPMTGHPETAGLANGCRRR
ncbi:unnamed protein product [Protopolystoma xenopodis]|uniref:Uncharacterized protein n=1 Tax=Protopolystoma xenopodis TaxID=117903 RepID=A0A3S5BC57_9PLAT|nr:unnamed protein product [Protopolystoma xenopodis]